MVEWFKQFFSDFIHLTEGEKFIKYWYVWLTVIILMFLYLRLKVKKK